MRRDVLTGQGKLVTALLKLAAEKFGPPKDWDREAVSRWIRSEVAKAQQDQFDPKAAQTGERE